MYEGLDLISKIINISISIIILGLSEGFLFYCLTLNILNKFGVKEFKNYTNLKFNNIFFINIVVPTIIHEGITFTLLILNISDGIRILISLLLLILLICIFNKVKSIYSIIRVIIVSLLVFVLNIIIEAPIFSILVPIDYKIFVNFKTDLTIFIPMIILKLSITFAFVVENKKKGKSIIKIIGQDKVLLNIFLIITGLFILNSFAAYYLITITKVIAYLPSQSQMFIKPILVLFPIEFLIITIFLIKNLTGSNIFRKMTVVERFNILSDTLYELNSTVSSIYDTKKLLGNFGKIILESTRADNITIIMYDDKNLDSKLLHLEYSSLIKIDDLNKLENNINVPSLQVLVENKNSFIDNNVKLDNYKFLNNREISSLMCLPIFTNNESFGLILLESRHPEMFDKELEMGILALGNHIGVILENSKLYTKVKEMAVTDGLTGISNRLGLQQTLSDMFEKTKISNMPLTAVICDIDKFKSINDTYGHLFGDKVIKTIALILKDSLRPGQFVARYGGEEFVILLPGYTAEQVYSEIDQIREKMRNTKIKDENIEINFSMSFGIASHLNLCTDESQLLTLADKALYHSKETGRNKVTVYSSILEK